VTTTERPVTPATAAEWRRRKEADAGLPPDGHNGQSASGHNGQSANGEQPGNGRGGLPHPGEKAEIRNGFRVPAYAAEEPLLALTTDAKTRTNEFPGKTGTARSPLHGTIGSGIEDSQRAGLTMMLSLAKAEAPPPAVPAVTSGATEHRPPTSAEGLISAAPTPTAPASAQRTSVIDLLSAPGRPPLRTSRQSTASTPHIRLGWETVSETPRFAQLSRLSLVMILTVQACLTIRLLDVNTAFQDEALYLWAGHLEWAHWLHGTPIPLFPAYFSGAPVIYPPIGALADSIGGLIGARILSLCFMLGATTLLWATTSRLYGRRAAFFAAGSWAVLGPTQFLGAFATFDAMSLFLVGLAAWCVVHGARREDATRWMLGGATALALANATKYASILYDPVIIAIAVLAAFPRLGGKVAAGHGASIATYLAAILVSLVTLGGGYYWSGLTSTTLTRVDGTDRPMVVLIHSWTWIGALTVVAVFGVILCIVRERRTSNKILLLVLVCAGLLAPLEQARIHTATSLDKHVIFGAWFVAVAVGYAADRLVVLIDFKALRTTVFMLCAAALVIAASVGMTQAQALFGNWANTSSFVSAFRPMVAATPGRLLVETASDPEYYLSAGRDWKRWSSTFSIVLPSGRTIGHLGGVTDAGAPAVYARYIAKGYFSLVALNFQETPQLDTRLAYDLSHNRAYRLVTSVPYGEGRYLIWRHRLRKVEQ
jgi:4-amino-4-deoxy-L-arabinose transferase-like glycosyltransferase